MIPCSVSVVLWLLQMTEMRRTSQQAVLSFNASVSCQALAPASIPLKCSTLSARCTERCTSKFDCLKYQFVS